MAMQAATSSTDASSIIGSGNSVPTPCNPTSPIELGLLLFNLQLTSDARKKITTSSSPNNQHLPCTLDDLLKDAIRLKESCVNHRSPAQKWVEDVLTSINTNAQVIDVLIQQQPDITAVLWGAFRFLIGVAVKEIDTTQKIGEALVDIVGKLGRWNGYLGLFDEFERVRKAAADLFSQIINFLVRARIYYQKPRHRRYLKVGLSPYAQKLERIMSLIHKHAEALECEANLASQFRLEQDRRAHEEHVNITRQFRKEVPIQLEETKSEIEMIIQQEALRQECVEAIKWLRQLGSSPYFERQEGTCTWVQKTEEWSTWTSQSYSQPLCICGPPGSGKSTIATYLFENSQTKITITHVFQSVTNKEQASSTPFAATVLGDLLLEDSVKSSSTFALAVHQVTELSMKNKMVGRVAFQKLWDIVLELVTYTNDFTLIADGLDECDEKSEDELSRELRTLSSHPNARLIILFRPHPRLERAFQDCPIIDITPTTIENDIGVYVSAEIQRHPKLQQLGKKAPRKISSSSQGVFLYAKLMLTHLKMADKYKEQRRCIEHAPPDVYAWYEKLSSATTAELTPSSLLLRREIFLVLLAGYKLLTCKELFYVIGLEVSESAACEELDALIDSEDTVLRLCGPLVQISKHHVHLIHETVKDFLFHPPRSSSSIHITSEESEAYLASKCLAALLREEYRSLNKIAILVRQNVDSATVEQDEDKYFYRYAATHWYIHLTAVRNPKQSLVQQTANFVLGNAFVSWSEFIFQISGSQGTALEVESKLKIWKTELPADLKDILILEDYFSRPYQAAAKGFEDDAGDKTLPYLCLFQLGEYYNLAARIEEAFRVKQMVAEGLVNLLGERHPLSLKAEAAFAIEYLGQRRFPEAEATFSKLAQIQREVLGEDRPDCFVSLQRQGMAELWMTKFAEADMNVTESLSGFSNTVGVTSFFYLMSQLTLGQVLEYQGEVRRASLDYEHIWRYRASYFGLDNPMAVWARCAMASTYRKLRQYEDADKAIGEVIDSRTRTIGPKSSPTVDAIIQRTVLYLDMERYKDALELVDFLLDGDLVDEWFERAAQVNHVRALSELFTGKTRLAISILQSLVDQSQELGLEGKLRSMLWVRLDLATLLRKEGRGDEALMLFDEIVMSADHDSSSSWEKPQGPSELVIAEKALRLVRDLKVHDAELLLEGNGLKWALQKYFWILNGSPPADTARMKQP